jgi:transcriptional regulator GlxA family with amidase domain
LELASIEEMLMLTLLSIQSSNYHVDSGRSARVSPRQFKQAVEYIKQQLDTDMRLSDIADAACCSIRSLTRAFHLACDTTPMQYVHGLRLQRVRARLSNTQFDDQTIAEIAYHCGFRHLGEFNRKYRETFGETPSETRAGWCAGSEQRSLSLPPQGLPA